MTRRKPRAVWSWLLLAAGAAWPAACPRQRMRRAETRPPSADWFLTIKLPPLAGRGVESELQARRVGEWLDSLSRAGFEPMLLSEARARLARGERLPGKPVVVVLEPGYARTQRTVLPELRRRGWPAVWLVDPAAVARRDERYVSRHALAELRRAPWCETGELAGSTKAFTLSGRDWSWAPAAGRSALNRAADAPLRRLNVRFSWTGEQLARRLQAEVPPPAAARLSAVRLYGRLWGVALDPDAPDQRFDLEAPGSARSASVAWRGTAGLRDQVLRLDAESVTGELWAYLRYDAAAGSGLRVGLTPEGVVVEELSGGSARRLAFVSAPARPGLPERAVIEARGRRLRVEARGTTAEAALRDAGSPAGELLLLTYDKIRGVGCARGTRLRLERS